MRTHTIAIVVLCLSLLLACGHEDALQKPLADDDLKQVASPELVCHRVCAAAGYATGEWCRCDGYAPLACVCRPDEHPVCGLQGCSEPAKP